jgi:hypothetical protein
MLFTSITPSDEDACIISIVEEPGSDMIKPTWSTSEEFESVLKNTKSPSLRPVSETVSELSF